MDSPAAKHGSSPLAPSALFRLILILIPFLFLLILEMSLRVFWSGAANLDLFIDDPFSAKYFTVNQVAGKRYFSGSSYGSFGTQDVFLKEKPANGIRIFVLGGSSTAGYPYMYAGSFPAMLRQRLEIQYPDKTIEVINLGMTAVNSYTVRDFALECLAYTPDALVIYAGHNEFYGALGTGSSQSSLFGNDRSLTLMLLKIRRLATYRFIRSLLSQFKPSRDSAGHQTLMARMAREQQISLDSPLYRKTLDIFQANMQDIIDRAGAQDTPVIIGSLASNVKDQAPFVSLVPVQCDSSRLRSELNHIRDRMVAGKYKAAARGLDSLDASCPGYALTSYYAGQCAEILGDTSAALNFYRQARDFDGLRFRASSDLNRLIRTLCEKNKAVFYAPVEEDFQRTSPGGLIGNNLILEHLHPNLNGYFQMARTVADVLENSVLPPPILPLAAADEPALRSIAVTTLDSAIAHIRIRLLTSGWPFQSHKRFLTLDDIRPRNDIERLALAVLNKTTDYEKAHVQLARKYAAKGDWRRAVREYHALATTFTNNESPLKAMGKLLVENRDFQAALPVLLKTLKLVEDGYSYKWAGTILLNQHELARALPLLERGKQFLARDTQLLYNLSGAYYMSGEKAKAVAVLNDILRINPDDGEARQFLARIQSARSS